jgi:hypothetical protein
MQLSDLVRDAKLPTKFRPNHTVHTVFESSDLPRRQTRRQRREEIWVRSKKLGCGGYGTVWLEECGTRLRAVKEIVKNTEAGSSAEYIRELEAIAKFSHSRVIPSGCAELRVLTDVRFPI